jgi:hypothetical protein
MKPNRIRAFVLTGVLSSLSAASGCVADRPSRNGVFDENQYLRKDFLIRPGDGSKPDPGWIMKSTVLATSTPNPLSKMGLTVGSENGGSYVRFEVLQDKLNMVNVREITPDTVPVSGDPNGSTASVSAQGTRTGEVLNAWPITNVDLKYRVNLDGEKTNFYEENQELDWQLRQWVKINFAKNDLSDAAPFGPFVNEFLQKCTDVIDGSAVLVPGSFVVDERGGYWQFTVRLTLPIKYGTNQTTSVDGNGAVTAAVDTTCPDAFGAQGVDFQRMGRQNVTLDMMYSFMRAVPDGAITYKPLVIDEHDPIRRKYGTIDIMTPNIDPKTGLLGTRALALRFDPAKPDITYYFAQGYPDFYKQFFLGPSDGSGGYKGGGIVDQTNAILAKAGAAMRLGVKSFDEDLAPGQSPRQMGDVRYNFIRWISDVEAGGFPTLAATQFIPDPRTGEILSDSINVYDWSWRDYVLARLDFYEQTIGAVNWDANPGPCQDGDTIPLVPAVVKSSHNGNSTLFQKMQQYLQRPVAQYGKLGPQDFVVQQDADFFKAYYALIPYQVFADPTTNPYVIPEGGTGVYAGGMGVQLQALSGEAQFHDLMGKLDHGWSPYEIDTGPAGLQPAIAFVNQLKDATIKHRDYEYLSNFRFPMRKADNVDMYSLVGLFQRDARHCIAGQWETREQYVDNLVMSYYAQTVWHEFGHALGLDHNFMASIDRNNFPHYKDQTGRDHVGAYSSSLMEYNTTADRVFWANQDGQAGWFPYDRAAIGFVYGNAGSDDVGAASSANPQGKVGNSVSGQSGTATDGTPVVSANRRWADPYGVSDNDVETQFLFCNATHLKYSPLCRQHDFGTTPSEIVAADIDNYEWQYLWRNFRQYHKYFDFSAYADGPTTFLTELRRFLSAWRYDWSPGKVQDSLRRLGITPPPGSPSGQYYDQVTSKFEAEMAAANGLGAATFQAIVQQSSGERPFKTTTDGFFGDTTQQGIIVDKLAAITGFASLWKTDNYDPNQTQGRYIASFTTGDGAYATLAEQAIKSMVGGGYDIFTYATPSAVLAFSQATHDINFPMEANRPETRDWIGGHTFGRLQDFLDFFRDLAVQNHFADQFDASGNPIHVCTSLADCTYDPRVKSTPEDPLVRFHSDVYNQFLGPDFRRWIWSNIQDRNAYVVADRDRNVATFVIQFNYNSAIYFSEEDGSGETSYSAYGLQQPLKYFYDYFSQFN